MTRQQVSDFLQASDRLQFWLGNWRLFSEGRIEQLNSHQDHGLETNETFLRHLLEHHRQTDEAVWAVADQIIIADGDASRIARVELYQATAFEPAFSICGASAHEAACTVLVNLLCAVYIAQEQGILDADGIQRWIGHSCPVNSAAVEDLAMRLRRERALFAGRYGTGAEKPSESFAVHHCN
ncbi:hypothetical protein SH661x_002304 [Planctomicrobium sp. SH661]|uniref:hypothetical protein n=1 Tax=Planctomicrobium sp. SH661 TaxID=3448124 RepID=UPI003F5BFAC2